MKSNSVARSFLTLLLLTGPGAAWARGASDECGLASPTVIHQAPHELLETWILDDAPILWTKRLPDNAALLGFRKEIQDRVADLDPYSILRREYQDFVRSGEPSYLAETAKIQLVVAKEAGAIRPMNCLEAALLSVQLARQPMIEQPSEFGAFILRNSDAVPAKLKIYYSTRDTPGGKIDPVMMDLIDADLASGWILWRHLHNHNFFFQGQVSVMGGVCPSKPDVSLYLDFLKSRELRSASITNGFDTIDLSPDDFRRLDI